MGKNDRTGDPEAWKCLDDDQREIIHEWYQKVCEYDNKDKKIEETRELYSTLFLSIPITVFYHHGFSSSGLTFWKYILELAAGFVVFGLLLFIGKEAISHFTLDCETEKGLFAKSLLVSLVLAFVVECICARIY